MENGEKAIVEQLAIQNVVTILGELRVAEKLGDQSSYTEEDLEYLKTLLSKAEGHVKMAQSKRRFSSLPKPSSVS